MLTPVTIGIIGLTITTIGKILISYTAVMVHHRVRMEHKMDEKVFSAMRRESKLGIFGILLLVVGYLLELTSRVA